VVDLRCVALRCPFTLFTFTLPFVYTLVTDYTLRVLPRLFPLFCGRCWLPRCYLPVTRVTRGYVCHVTAHVGPVTFTLILPRLIPIWLLYVWLLRFDARCHTLTGCDTLFLVVAYVPRSTRCTTFCTLRTRCHTHRVACAFCVPGLLV